MGLEHTTEQEMRYKTHSSFSNNPGPQCRLMNVSPEVAETVQLPISPILTLPVSARNKILVLLPQNQLITRSTPSGSILKIHVKLAPSQVSHSSEASLSLADHKGPSTRPLCFSWYLPSSGQSELLKPLFGFETKYHYVALADLKLVT